MSRTSHRRTPIWLPRVEPGVLPSVSDREAGPARAVRTGDVSLAERERRSTPPFGGVFVARSRVMDADDVQRATWRMGHEIIERNHGLDDVVIIGLQTGGVVLAHK